MPLLIHKKLLAIILLFIMQAALLSQQQAPVIGELEFTGNDFFSAKELTGFILSKPGSPFTKMQFELDLRNIIKIYQENGYLDCSISENPVMYNFDSTAVTLGAAITEGKRCVIGNIKIDGAKLFSEMQIKENIDTKTGSVLNSVTLNNDMTAILNLYEKKGYTFAQVHVSGIEQYTENGIPKVKVNIRIEENEKIKIDEIKIEGNTTTKDYVITREIPSGGNNSLSRENLLEIKRKLENLGYFESVELPKILKYRNLTVLLIKVKEGNTNTFDGIIGYVPPAQNEDNGYFTGFVNLSIRNLFGTGRKVEARFKKEIRTTQELELGYLEPWILGYPFSLNTSFLQRVEDSSYIKRNLNLKGDAFITERITVSALFDFERVIPTTDNNIFSLFDSRLLSIGAELKYDSRNYVYNPFSGIYYRTSYSAGQKKIYNAASFPERNIQSDFTVQKGAMHFDFYHSFFKRQSSLISLHGIEIRSPEFEAADLFRLGGNNTIRGYREGQFLSSRAAWGNIELRYSLTRRSFAAVFYDIGYYLKPEDRFYNLPSQEGLLYGYGLGIRIETSLGMFGVSYALGRGDALLEGKIHFGLINDF